MHALGGPVNLATAVTVPGNEVEGSRGSTEQSPPLLPPALPALLSLSIPRFVIPTLTSQRAGGLDEPRARLSAVILLIGGFLWTLGGRDMERRGRRGGFRWPAFSWCCCCHK